MNTINYPKNKDFTKAKTKITTERKSIAKQIFPHE